MNGTFFTWILNKFPRPFLIKASYWARPFLAFYLSGKKMTDPINGKSYKRFLPYGYGISRPGVLAPGTLSLERHRLLWLFLKAETNLFTIAQSVLHMAPEQAFFKRFKKLKHLKYTTADLYSPLAMVKADICNLPFKDGEFSVVLCNHVLEHIEDHQKAISELYRVMKPGGWGIFQVPQELHRETTFEDNSITDKKERAKIFGQYDHVRIYGKDFISLLNQSGFKSKGIPYANKLSEVEIKKYSLQKEVIPVAIKS